MAINTACSSGLVAAHQAFQSLQLRECDTAIAAGINIMMSPEPYVTMSQAGMLSPDGVCHTFDKRANGMVPGEAVAVVVLKRLSEAMADGDPIYATIRGSGINYDGKTNGITAPSSLSQTELLRSVYSQCQVNPEKVEYIIAHGTGTRLGDPVEINALNDAFLSYTHRQNYCALTSNKTNFGHTFAASGLVSLINLVQSLRHEAIPPSLHCDEQSDYLPLDKSPFFINKRVKAWPSVPGKPRLGGVSAFGMSGTNAHMVLESYEAEKRSPAGDHHLYYLLPLSGKTEVALNERISQLILAFESGELHGSLMEEVSYTLMAGRHHFKYRCAVIAKDHIEAMHVLKLAAGMKPGSQWVSGEVSRDFKAGREMSGLLMDQAAQRNLYALAEQYCQGYDIPWERLFPGKIPGRIHLPTYPFSRREYRMSKGKKDGSDLRQKQWLTIREELIPAAIPEGIDWNGRLGRFAGKRICIVYWREEDRSGLTGLLEKLEKAGRMQGKLNIQILQVNNLNTEAIKKIRPEIVMVPGMPERGPGEEQAAKADLSVIFQLSKTLMQAAWDDPIRIYFLYHSDLAAPQLEREALSGFFRSAVKENEMHSWKVIRLYREDRAGERYQILLKEWLLEELATSDARTYTEIHYKDGQRFIKELTETELPAAVKPAFRIGGNYLVVGGTGFVGGQLCQEIALKYHARLFILSRSPHDEKIKEQRRRLQELGVEVHYFSADATEKESLESAYKQIKSMGVELHGVINLARAHDSHIIANKSWESFDKVSMSKIRSAQYLDQLTKDEPLDFFMLFASMAAFGISGESDYAYSCAFQNAFARHRNRMTDEGQRSGVAITLCWGPWVEDKLFPENAEKFKTFGCDVIDMSDAFPFIEASCVHSGGAIGIIAVRNVDKIRNWYGIEKGNGRPAQQGRAENKDATQQSRFENGDPARWEATIRKWEEQKKTGKKPDFAEIRRVIPVAEMEVMEAGLIERIYNLCFEEEYESVPDVPDDLREVIRGVIMEALQIETLDDAEPLQSYGLDSIKAMRLSVNLEKKLNRHVQPQWFIVYPTVQELSQFLTFDQTILI
jgi:acyl carrier protein